MGWWSRLFSSKPEPARREEPSIDGPVESPVAAGHSPLDAEAARALRDGSPEFDEYIVRAELDAGTNLPHAALHLANLLLVDPRHPRWLELLDRLVAAAGTALDALAPDADPRHASTEALRAWIWQRQGRLDDAVSRMVGITDAIADPRMLDGWALAWLEPAGAVESLTESTGLQLFATLLNQHTEALHATATQLATLRRWSALLERAAPAWEANGLLRMLRAGLLRKAGRFDDALTLAGVVQEAVDGHHIAAIGLALRADGQLVESARTFEHGAHVEPTTRPPGWRPATAGWKPPNGTRRCTPTTPRSRCGRTAPGPKRRRSIAAGRSTATRRGVNGWATPRPAAMAAHTRCCSASSARSRNRATPAPTSCGSGSPAGRRIRPTRPIARG